MFTDSPNRKLIFFFSGLMLFAALLVIGTNFLLELVPAEEKPVRRTLPPIEAEKNDMMPDGREGPLFRIQRGAVDLRPIIYTSGGFEPVHRTIQSSDDIGCLITVVNKSAAVLRIGVNPHDERGDPGANYGEIQPGETGILDVRYPGLVTITLHSHSQPEHEFSIAYGQGCQ